MRHWEEILGRPLPQPVVLEGDLSQPLCGLSADARGWVAEHCDELLNNAASLTFRGSDRDAEPWRTNLTGTGNALALAREWLVSSPNWAGSAALAALSTPSAVSMDPSARPPMPLAEVVRNSRRERRMDDSSGVMIV